MMKMHRNPRPSGRAFTLVELLVVVAILSLLVSLLAPSLKRATGLTYKITCRSNLGQLQKGYAAYGVDSSGRLLPYICNSSRPDAFWMEALRQYYGNLDDIRDCPLVTKRSGGWGDTWTSWGPGGGWMAGNSGSYAINGYMYDMMTNYAFHDERDFEILAVPDAENVPVWFDCCWVDAWPVVGNVPPTDYAAAVAGWNDGGMGRLCIDRHDFAVNLGFADGSARPVELPDLWLLRWNKLYTPQYIAFPEKPN